MQKVFLILLFLVPLCTTAQQNRVKIGVIIIPSGSGFLIGDAGFERLNKALNKSWQLHLNASGGEIALDAGDEKRIWGTVEKTFYKKTVAPRITWSYSFFTEVGTRLAKAGRVYYTPAKTFSETKQFEINPGASIGLQYRLGKRFRLEAQAGPKIIFATGHDYFKNSILNQKFRESANEVKAGLRLTGVLSYQF